MRSSGEGAARAALLEKVLAHAAAHGLSDTSLRDLAAAVGTSHRMLLYHFGSRDGLVAAIVAAVEARQREALRVIAATATSPGEVVRRQWAQLADPALAPFVRLFFEVAALALRRRPGTEGFLDDAVGPWLEVAGDVGRDLGLDVQEADVRAGIALVRGLLLDLVATGDRAGTTAALERFLVLWERDLGVGA
jgi:AcrR family transcriptional regulator